MPGAIIWYVTMFACAALFWGIGAYANRIEKPMWFWAGDQVDPSQIQDVKSYNRENARMWKLYSVWYWVGGLAWRWSQGVALTVLILSCTVGIGILINSYLKIEKKYKITGL